MSAESSLIIIAMILLGIMFVVVTIFSGALIAVAVCISAVAGAFTGAWLTDLILRRW